MKPPSVSNLKHETTGRWLLHIGRPIHNYVIDARVTALHATTTAARCGELLFRFRRLGRIERAKAEAIGLEVGFPRQTLKQTLEDIAKKTTLISVEPGEEDDYFVAETILTEADVCRATNAMFFALDPSPVERSLPHILEQTTLLPSSFDQICSGIPSEDINERSILEGIELLESFGLISSYQTDDYAYRIYFNPIMWQSKISRIGSILASIPQPQSNHLLSLVEEVRRNQGQSRDRLTSAPPQVIAMAIQTGIIDCTTITTAEGQARDFVFSPHFGDYGAPGILTDVSDQVKLFVSSIAYGQSYSNDFRLHSPIRFVEKLLNTGEAGNATPILSDYILLEKQGIVTVEKRSFNRGTLKLVKSDVVDESLQIMKMHGAIFADGDSDSDILLPQNGFSGPAAIRSRLAVQASATPQFERNIIASIRSTALQGEW